MIDWLIHCQDQQFNVSFNWIDFGLLKKKFSWWMEKLEKLFKDFKIKKNLHITAVAKNPIIKTLSANLIKKMGVNIKNENNCCFMSAVIQALAYTKFRDLIIRDTFHTNCAIKRFNDFCVACDLKSTFINLFIQTDSIKIQKFIENIEGNKFFKTLLYLYQ